MGEIKQGYKKTEIGVIPEDWELKNGEEITLKITKGASPKWQGFDYQNDGMLFITSENVRNGFIDVSSPKFLPLGFHGKLLNSQLAKGDLLINIVGASIGRACIFNLEIEYANINQAVAVFRLKEEYDSIFILNYILETKNKSRLLASQSDSARPNISLGDLKQFKFAIPPLKEQQMIANALSVVDAQVTALDELIAKKREIKQGAMQKLLTGEERLEGFSGEWAEKRLGEIADIKRGASPRPIADPKWFGGTVGWVRISDVTLSHIYLLETIDYLSDLGVEQSVQIFHGELIMSIAATVGLFAITKMEACIHDGFVVFKNLHEKVDVLFLYYYLTFFSKVFADAGQTGSQKNVNANIVNRIKIRLPDHAEQQAIAKILSAMDTEIADIEAKREKVANLKQGMMQELLTGRTRLV